ncbi:MAG: GtrA family protein [Dysgonamonadaceae bacterium]|jgi:putative flippase GtrA|nr:GtrA family protein [Dysgonamonadaceae bacterium]
MIDKFFVLKFLKFCSVGFSGMIIDFGTTWLLKEKIKINKFIANSCGFVLAASSNYIWNRIWTFKSHNEQITTEFLSFLVISLLGLGLNNLVLWVLSDKLKQNFYLSKVFAIGTVTLWNFGMNFIFTF